MPFLDEVEVILASGSGGQGCLSFRRERFMPRGGPDGGDGGRGGDLFVVGRPFLTTLDHLGGQRRFAAGKGQPGSSSNCHGRDGEDFHFELPVGTLVRDAERGHVLHEITQADRPVRVLKGGRGGRGNRAFRSATRRAPRHFERGGPAEERRVRLELKILADVGLLGLPNAGKSTLLTRITAARPRIGAYAFSTLGPKIGVLEHDFETLTLADLPGILQGAHEGRGLGDRFLRHIERTRILLHLLDASSGEVHELLDAYRTVRREIEEYGRGLDLKPELIVATKMDLRSEPLSVSELERALGSPVALISALTGDGVDALVQRLFELAAASR